MEFQLFRNIDSEDLKAAFIKSTKENQENSEEIAQLTIDELKKKYGSSIIVNLQPGINLRKKGTLQKGKVNISFRSWKYDNKSMYLVVSCNRKWAKEDEIETQRYALVISVSHSNPEIDLYNKIKVKTRISQRLRVR